MPTKEPIGADSAGEASKAPDAAVEAERQFRDEVLPDELEYVRDRRQSHGLSPDVALDPAAGTGSNLVGLALSGGGIRSATFNLGILQALHRHGFFKHVDYLATVSGGGFIGSSLTALMSEGARKRSARPATNGARGTDDPEQPSAARFPFPYTDRGDEEETVKYLRGHSDYLAPKGLDDYLRAFALLSRGIALNLLLLLPILLIVSLLGTLFFAEDLVAAARRDGWIGALTARLEKAPKVDLALLTSAGRPLAFEPDAVLAALSEEPPLIRSVGVHPRFEDGVDWEQIAARLADLDETRRSNEPPVLDFKNSAKPQVLTYRHADGLQVWNLEAPESEPLDLWTDSYPVETAVLSPDLRQIAAAGVDGSLWVFYPSDPADLGGSLCRKSGLLSIEGAPVERLAVSMTRDWQTPTGAVMDSRLIARFSDERVLVLRRPANCASASVEPGTATDLAPQTELPPRSRPPSEAMPERSHEDRRPAWNPRRLHLPRTGWTLIWISILFIGLYPAFLVLGSPLERLAAGLTSGLRGFAALLGGLRRRKGEPAAKRPGPSRSRGLAAAWRVAGSALLALPLFGLSIEWFDGWEQAETQQYWWPWLAVFWMGLWWLLCFVFLLPVLRRWRPRTVSPSPDEAKPPSRVIFSALLLLAPWVPLGLALGGFQRFFFHASPLAREIPTWLVQPWFVIPAWWISCLLLLKPILFFDGSPQTGTTEKRLEWHRSTTGRMYVAANLLLWTYLALAAFHPIVREGTGTVLESVVAGFGVEEGALDPRFASVALLGFIAGVQFLLWRVFAWLARGRVEPSTGSRMSKLAATASSILWRERYEKAFSLGLVALAAVAFFEIQPYLVYHFHALKERYSVEWLYLVAAASFVAIVLAAMFLQAIKGVGQKLILLCLGILGPLLPFFVYLTFVEALVYQERWLELRGLLFSPADPWITRGRVSFLIVTVAVAAYLLGKLVDANATGMHGFYRDRLSQGYLVGVDKDGILGPEQELSLLDICPAGSGAPYHLINASLNMQGESAGAQRWRSSDFFVFSARWCGGPYGEYCRTEHLEYLAPSVHLGSAMAVSAAAAAPNMGSYTSGFLVMLMTLLNVRLGLWVPTPRRVRRMVRLGMIGSARGITGRLRRWWMRLKNRPSGYYLVDEMRSRLDASGPYVNLSDGGHLENTGAYELLRRRCKFIVIGDAESDPKMQFGSLAALLRFASIDLGIQIEIDLGPLRLRQDNTSKGHYAVGTIHYPPLEGSTDRETGHLLYVKTSVDGSESEIIREYRARHPDFPQESTADQVFEEDQFEAYRALGFGIGSGLFGVEDRGFAAPADIDGWFARLAGTPADPAPG